jgi:NifB/MoaA-like Fe-S oxidoreductase
MVLFGEMASQEDCQQRSERAWQKLIEGCKQCTMALSSCKADLEPRYRKLFDNAAIHSSYLSFTRGSRFERNGRMVVYGLTSDQGDAVCGSIVTAFQQRYEGKVSCVHGRRD